MLYVRVGRTSMVSCGGSVVGDGTQGLRLGPSPTVS